MCQCFFEPLRPPVWKLSAAMCDKHRARGRNNRALQMSSPDKTRAAGRRVAGSHPSLFFCRSSDISLERSDFFYADINRTGKNCSKTTEQHKKKNPAPCLRVKCGSVTLSPSIDIKAFLNRKSVQYSMAHLLYL